MKFRLWVLGILFLMSFESFAKECRYPNDFTVSTIQALKAAQQLRSKDLVGLRTGGREFNVEVLHSDLLDRFIVIFGEVHIQGRRASNISKKVVSHFPIRMVEATPPAEFEKLCGGSGRSYQYLQWISRFLTFRFFDATSDYALDHGLLISMIDRISYNGQILKEFKGTSIRTSADVFNLIERVDPTMRDEINLPLEVGPYLEPSHSDDYLIARRNGRMVENILIDLERIEKDITPLVIVGFAHVKGLKARLRKAPSAQFESCDHLLDNF